MPNQIIGTTLEKELEEEPIEITKSGEWALEL